MNDDILLKLYETIKTNQNKQKTVREMSDDERRLYMSKAAAEYRKKQRTALESGNPDLTSSNIRNALADAAIAILATDANGSDEVKKILSQIFSEKSGAAFTITARIKSGRVKAKLLK